MALERERIARLDHLAVMVRDLSAAAAAYQRLGFQLTPVSQHSGARTPGGPVTSWGTGNRCAMLARGYIELMGVIDSSLYDNRVPEYLARYEGIHILAFASDDAASVADRLAREGFAVSGVHGLERELDVPGGRATARFKLVRTPESELPEGRVLAIEHLTPEHLWQARYLDHPNGAQALTELAVCVADIDEAVARYRRFLGRDAGGTDRRRVFDFGGDRFVLLSEDGLASELGLSPPTLPFAASFTVAVEDIDRTRRVLDGNGVGCQPARGDLVVRPADACGAQVIFRAA